MTREDEGGGGGDVDVQYSRVTCIIIFIYVYVLLLFWCARARIRRSVGRRRDSMSCVTRVAYNIIRVVMPPRVWI